MNSSEDPPPRIDGFSGKPSRWQWSLLTLLLITAAVATWTAAVTINRRNERLRNEIASMQLLTRELIITDPQQLAAIAEAEQWFSDDRWQVHLPRGGRYAIKMATRNIAERGPVPAELQAPLTGGRHQIVLDDQKEGDEWLITVRVDGQAVFRQRETADWHPGQGSSSSGVGSHTQQASKEEHLVLKRERFHERQRSGRSSAPDKPGNGLMLWIEWAGAEEEASDTAP